MNKVTPYKRGSARKKGPGRPRALVPDEQTLHKLRVLAEIQTTQGEAASVLGVSRKTLNRFLKRDAAAGAAWEAGRAAGLVTLRKNQFRIAETNATMAIWLGKQYLGQRDQPRGASTPESLRDDHLPMRIERIIVDPATSNF